MPLKYKHTILLVDDEVSITRSLQRLFRKEKYNILSAASGPEGLDILKRQERAVSLIISDQRMPIMNGAEFLEKVKELVPDSVRFLLTGFSDMDAVVDAVNKGEIHRYLAKPWNDQDLLIQVRQALEQYELTFENRRLNLLIKEQNKKLKELNQDLEKKVEERSQEIIEKNKKLSQANKELENSLFNTVRAFASLSELHVPLLAGHGKRVSRMSRGIALCLELDRKEIVHVEIAALLHDIGKLGLNENLINYREKKWSADDREAYQKHPEESQIVVGFIKRLDHVSLLIRSHHERFDGQGFPDKLSEEIIPLGSRIISVADAYDRITNLRVNSEDVIAEFKKHSEITLDHISEDDLIERAAIFHLKQNSFTQYDPEVVKAFFQYLKSKGIEYKNEKLININDLKPGMLLSRSLYTQTGKFLIPYNTKLTEDYIQKLKVIYRNDKINETIHVITS